MRSHNVASLLEYKYLDQHTAFSIPLGEIDPAVREHLTEKVLGPGIKDAIKNAKRIAEAYKFTLEDIIKFRLLFLSDVID